MSQFVHLRLHSEYSIKGGAARLSGGDSVVRRAAELEMPALAISDEDNLFGAVKFYDACAKNGVKPLIGCDAAVEKSRLLLLCKNEKGFGSLCALLSRAQREKLESLPAQWLQDGGADGLLALSGAMDGDIGAHLLKGRRSDAAAALEKWQGIFGGDNFYLEARRGGARGEEKLAAETAKLAREKNAPPAATHAVKFTKPEDFRALEARTCIINNWPLADPERPRPFNEKQFLQSGEEMRKLFADLPEAVENTLHIARRCNFAFVFDTPLLPRAPKSADGETPEAALARAAREGLDWRLKTSGGVLGRGEYEARLEAELKVICQMGFAGYFLVVAEFVGWAHEKKIPVGPGRGSGVGSLAAWSLGITGLDPLRYGLLFERFLNPDRVSLPDFDIDFCPERRDEVIAHVRETYGAEAVSQIVTFGHIAAKAAVRDVGRILGLPYGKCDRLARAIPGGPDVTLARAEKESKEFAEAVQEDEETRELMTLAREVEGLPRNIGTHAGGIIIAPRRIDQHCPLYAPADGDGLVSQFDKDDVEKIGLVKFDFLGMATLTVLARGEAMLRARGKVADDFSWENVPLDDADVYKLYAEGDTLGVFQCEGDGMRAMMRRIAPTCFDDIIAAVALFRPGPLDSGMMDDYIKRKHGGGEALSGPFAHPQVKAALADTRGVIVYQEQVMKLAQVLAGYSLGQADILRRAMGKKKPEEMRAARGEFVEAAAPVLGRDNARQLFDAVEKFAGYAFNKSHAAAYALASYHTAYLKARHPTEFYAATMSVNAGGTDKLREFCRDAARRSITIAPPDINRSGELFEVEEEGVVRYGIAALKGVGRGAARDIVAARESEPFADVFDFCQRSQSTRAVAESLAMAGAFDSLHANRAAVFAAAAPARQAAEESVRLADQGALFEDGAMAAPALPDKEEWDEERRLECEQKAAGFCLRGHFFDLYRDIAKNLDAQPLPGGGGISTAQAAPSGSGLFVGIAERKITSTRAAGYAVIVLSDGAREVEARVPWEVFKRELSEAQFGREAVAVRAAPIRDFRDRGDEMTPPRLQAAAAWRLGDYLTRHARRLQLKCEVRALPMLARLLREADVPGASCALRVHCINGAAEGDIDLQDGWALSPRLLRQLHKTPAIREVRVACG